MGEGDSAMFSALLPKGAPFFELLIRQNVILNEMGQALDAIINQDKNQIDEMHKIIASLEDQADKIYYTITKHLSQTFITPIDREDILRISKAQEEAIDHLHNVTNRLYIFEFPKIRFPMKQLTKTAIQMLEMTSVMLTGLSKKEDAHKTRAFRALRNESEMLLSLGIAELLDHSNPSSNDTLSIFKWYQTYDKMENLFDEVTRLSEYIEEAVLKNV